MEMYDIELCECVTSLLADMMTCDSIYTIYIHSGGKYFSYFADSDDILLVIIKIRYNETVEHLEVS